MYGVTTNISPNNSIFSTESIGNSDTEEACFLSCSEDDSLIDCCAMAQESILEQQTKALPDDMFQLKDYYLWKKPIGQGSFSDVYKGFHSRTKKVVAVKSLRLSKKMDVNRVQFEINIMKDLRHPNIIQLYEVLKEDDQIHLILEYCSGGTLEKYIDNKNQLGEAQIHHYLKDLSDGLKYLRKKHILHRDLKPHNLLISEENQLKISDFGLSILLENDKLTDTLCGSPLYMAPEVIMSNIYGVKSDLWSVGIIIYQLIYGKHPYTFTNIYELIQEITNKEIMYPPTQVSQKCLDLIERLLVVDNNQRLCWGEFFIHPWINRAEFIESSYKISQPISIKNIREGFVNDYTIKNYNPSYEKSRYDPVCKSEPTPRMKYLNSDKFQNSSDSDKSPLASLFGDSIFNKKKKIGQRYSVSYVQPKKKTDLNASVKFF